MFDMSIHGLRHLEFNEALKDSPRFRDGVRQHEIELAKVEAKLKEIIRQSSAMIEYGKNYINTFEQMLMSMTDLNTTCFSHDAEMCSAFGLITMAYEEIVKMQKMIVEQAHWSIVKNLNDFIKCELGKVADCRNQFERLSNSLDDALARNASSKVNSTMQKGNYHSEPTSSDSDANDSVFAESKGNDLLNLSTAFAHTSLDYAYSLNLIDVRKNHEIINVFQSFLAACQSVFKKGGTFFDDFAKDEAYITKNLDMLTQKARRTERKMQDRHMLVPKDLYDVAVIGGLSPDPEIVMEGYLFKRASNAFKQWHRRWFVIRHNMLLYRHRTSNDVLMDNHLPSKTTSDGFTIMEGDLRVCLVRPAPSSFDRAHCFELVTPNKTHLLQADSSALCTAWIKAVQRTIEAAILDPDSELNQHDLNKRASKVTSRTSSPAVHNHRPVVVSSVSQQSACSSSSVASSQNSGGLLPNCKPPRPTASPAVKSKFGDEIRSVHGNNNCADCGKKGADWCSINLAVTLCIDCAAIHRSFGVFVSKVRSLYLDAIEPEQAKVMLALGNNKVNAIYLAQMPANDHEIIPPRAQPHSTRTVRDAWCRAKYVERRFVRNAELNSPRNSSSQKVKTNRVSTDVLAERRLERLGSTLKSWSSDSHLDHWDLEKSLTPMREDTPGSETHLDQLEEHDHTTNLERQLIRACKAADLTMISLSIAQGADINCRATISNGTLSKHPVYTTPLHAAVESQSLDCMEYVLLNGAKVNVVDSSLRTPLHAASELGLTGHVCQLVKRGAAQDVKDAHGHTPLDLAIGSASDGCAHHSPKADIVTLLRVTKLRDELSNDESSMSSHMDTTVQEVIDDILVRNKK